MRLKSSIMKNMAISSTSPVTNNNMTMREISDGNPPPLVLVSTTMQQNTATRIDALVSSRSPVAPPPGVFPAKLHQMINDAETSGNSDIISWLPDGRSFKIHDRESFVRLIMPLYFGASKFRSFQRNLNLWNFKVSKLGPSRDIVSHPLFVRDSPELCQTMKREKIKNHNNRGKLQLRGGGGGGALSSPGLFLLSTPHEAQTTFQADVQPSSLSDSFLSPWGSPISHARRASMHHVVSHDSLSAATTSRSMLPAGWPSSLSNAVFGGGSTTTTKQPSPPPADLVLQEDLSARSDEELLTHLRLLYAALSQNNSSAGNGPSSLLFR